MAREKIEQVRRREADRRRKLDEALDEGLLGTFPGSDPVSVVQPPHTKYDKVIKREPETTE